MFYEKYIKNAWHTYSIILYSFHNPIWEEVFVMDTFDKLIEFQKELLQSQLKVVRRYQQQIPQFKKHSKRTSQLDTVEEILTSADQPLHISKIIEIAKSDFNVILQRDSIVSALLKKIQAGERFVRIAPNTFALKNNT